MTVNTGPQPSPAPSAPKSVDELLAGLNQAASTTSSSGGDKYGLGVWGSQNVDPGDLPFLTGIIGQGKATTGDTIMQAFLGADPDQVATVQHALYMAGYYPKNYTPKYGIVSTQDRAAFGQAITLAGQAGKPIAGLLTDAAAYGAQAGLAAAQASTTSQRKAAVVQLPNTQDLEAAAMAAFQSVLGHKASPKQAARFAATYRALSAGVQRANNQAEYDATAPNLDGSPLQSLDTTSAVEAARGLPQPQSMLTHELGTGAPTPVDTPSFTEQIGGLQQLGQGVAAALAGSAQPGGLTQITEETPIDPGIAAANYARNLHPHQAAGNDLANTFNTFLSLLNGLGGS